MAQMTFTDLIGEVTFRLGLDPTSGGEDETSVKRAINLAGRRTWQRFPWPERRVEATYLTTAPYSTGTATATNGNASLAGTGTAWTGFAGRKFCLGLNRPFYRLSAVGGDTAATLARNYAETTATDSTYLIYQDEIDTASAVDVIEQARLLYDNVYGPLLAVDNVYLNDYSLIQTTTGKPVLVGLAAETTAGTPRIRVSPVPDAVYAIQVTYLKAWTDLTSGSAVPSFAQNRESLLLMASILEAQQFASKNLVTATAVDMMAAEAFAASKSPSPLAMTKRTFPMTTGGPDLYWRVP